MLKNTNRRKITIVGAGMGGTFLAIALAKEGYKVTIYEAREDIRKIPLFSDRSINQSLSVRGVRALKKLGLWNQVKKLTIVEKGRIFHPVGKAAFFSAYGKNKKEVHYTFNRNELNRFLINTAASFKNVSIFFGTKCVSLDKKKRIVTFVKKGRTFTIKTDLLVGADGVNSVVRTQMQKGMKHAYARREYLAWGYKSIYADSVKKNSLRKDVFHNWPRDNSALFAIANRNGSFVCTLMLPLKGKESFASLRTNTAIEQFLKKNFSEIFILLPNLSADFKSNILGKFECVYADPWYHKDFIVLIGDACHAIMPFYSQGVSATFEDCITFMDCINRHMPSWEKALQKYQELRKRNTDVLTKITVERFYELKDGYRSHLYLARQEIEEFLAKKYPKIWSPLYSLISHTTIPYADAYKHYQQRERILKACGLDIAIASVAIKNMSQSYFSRLVKGKKKT